MDVWSQWTGDEIRHSFDTVGSRATADIILHSAPNSEIIPRRGSSSSSRGGTRDSAGTDRTQRYAELQFRQLEREKVITALSDLIESCYGEQEEDSASSVDESGNTAGSDQNREESDRTMEASTAATSVSSG